MCRNPTVNLPVVAGDREVNARVGELGAIVERAVLVAVLQKLLEAPDSGGVGMLTRSYRGKTKTVPPAEEMSALLDLGDVPADVLADGTHKQFLL